MSSSPDIDECTILASIPYKNTTILRSCHEKARCMNTVGSYKCQCTTGYAGDGFACVGKAFVLTIVIACYTSSVDRLNCHLSLGFSPLTETDEEKLFDNEFVCASHRDPGAQIVIFPAFALSVCFSVLWTGCVLSAHRACSAALPWLLTADYYSTSFK